MNGLYTTQYPELKEKMERVKEWIDAQSPSTFDTEEREELIQLADKYLFLRWGRTFLKNRRSTYSKDYTDRAEGAIKSAKHLRRWLLDGVPVTQGRELAEMLTDLIEHPEGYIHNPPKISIFSSRAGP